MSLPMGEIGIGAISGGTIVGLAIKLLPILLRKFNSKKTNNRNSVNPGKANICIERGKKIVEHNGAIVGLCGSVERIDKALELAHTENRQDFQRIFDKIDELKR